MKLIPFLFAVLGIQSGAAFFFALTGNVDAAGTLAVAVFCTFCLTVIVWVRKEVNGHG